MGRGDFRAGDATGTKERLVSGAEKDCLADAIAELSHGR
jgi:hypothetical protein